MMERLLRILPQGLSRRLARGAIPLVVGIVFLLLVAGLALAALVTPGTLGISSARVADTRPIPQSSLLGGLGTQDTDHDGLPDSLENYVYGIDLGNWNASGMGIPNGWLAQYGYDPLSPLTQQARGAAPPADVLAQIPAYAKGYPDAYRPTLVDYYSFGKPASYQPGVDDPWWTHATTVDPTQWDQAHTGIPTGWLLHYGLDPLHTNPDAVAPGAKGNLTVREAFTHNTNPLALSTTNNGVTDWDAIHVYHTDPSKFSTGGSGVPDGWALHYGLNPFDPNMGSQDPDRDGLTNLEEFTYSYKAFQTLVDTQGMQVLYTKGLDPTNPETAGTGIPDGWYVKYGLSPFGEDVNRIISNASDWPLTRGLPTPPAPGPKSDCTAVAALTLAPGAPIPDCAMTILDAYRYGRPATWNESVDGVWWGGTDPRSGDSAGSGMPDAVKIRGWWINVTYDTGPAAKARTLRVFADPHKRDTSGGGLTDLEKYLGQTTCGVTTPGADVRSFPPSDPRNADTAFSGMTDFEKVCGAVRGGVKYDLDAHLQPGQPFLDPTRADSAGDLMKDGPRLDFWAKRYEQYLASPTYPYNGSLYKTVFDWTKLYHRFDGMSQDQILAQFRPDGDVDGDGIPNVLDPDPSGGLAAEKDAHAAKTKVYFLGGPKMDPSLYSLTEFASPFPRPATDPANPDTDGDGLPDAWEIRYGAWDPSIHVGGQQGGWNLDPSRADSDGSGVTDDKKNLDGDVVTWYSYDAHGTAPRTSHTYSFTVKDEYLAGTDPNKLSTANDGVSDGWKAFWGSRLDAETFPSLLAANDPRVGDTILGDPARRAEVEDNMAKSPIQPLAKLSCDDGTCKVAGYVRFACAATDPTSVDIPCQGLATNAPADRCAALAAATTADPSFDARTMKADVTSCFEGQTLKGTQVKILPVDGVFQLSYADEQRLRVNPYLADTDGDGAPDAYEAYMLQQAKVRNPTATFPDPANPETGDASDPAKSGAAMADKCKMDTDPQSETFRQCGLSKFTLNGPDGTPRTYGAGADPNLLNTNGNGIDDGIAISANLNPLDPRAIDDFRNNQKDSDFDGVPDYLELTGFGKTQFNFDENVKTDPQRASTSGNGLLDGPDRFSTQVPASVVALWNATGIAHKTLANGTVEFYGAGTFHSVCGCLPNVLDSSHTGIPDGWYAYYLVNPSESAPPTAAYNLHKPSWWDESRMGVWWWGAPPGVSSVPTDLNGNGLNDNNGEDPLPSLANGTIATAKGPIGSYAEAKDWILSAPTPDLMRQRAQSIGDSPGEPAFARAFPNPGQRAPTQIVNLTLADGSGVVTKGVPFNVTGQLLAGSHGTPVANRTILLSFFGADATQVVGAGFTDATGHFNFTANVASGDAVSVPPGLVLLGQTRGTVTLPFDPSTVSTGAMTAGVANALVAWTYNTSATAAPGSPLYVSVDGLHATAFSATAAVPIVVRSDTLLDTTVGSVADNGGILAGDLRLTDKGGGALSGMHVTVSWNGAPGALPLPYAGDTDRAGHLNLTNLRIPVAVRHPGLYVLKAQFDSSDPNLTASTLAYPIDVRSPGNVTLALSAAGGTIGDTIALTGQLATNDVTIVDGSIVPGGPVRGAVVHVLMGGLDQPVTTDANGAFSLSFPIPATSSAGPQTVIARFLGDDAVSPAEAGQPFAVKRTSEIVDLSTLQGPRSLTTALAGRLVDNTGSGILGSVTASGARGFLGNAATDSNGAFSLDVPLSALPLGGSTINVTFAGDRDHGAAQNFTAARVTSATTLVVTNVPFSLVRGQSFDVAAQLLDDKGAPATLQAVTLSWRGQKEGTAVTDDQGNLGFRIYTNLSELPSPGEVALAFAPRTTSIYQGTVASATVQVLQGATLTLDARHAVRGVVDASGTLVDDEGHPVEAAPVTLRVGGADFGEARTARNGSFLLERPLPAGIPLGDVQALASFPGSPQLAPANATAILTLRTPLTLTLTQLAPLVRGETTSLAATLTDDQGAPVDGMLSVTFGGEAVGSLVSKGGQIAGGIAVPADLPRGATTLWINASATSTHDALAQSLGVVIKIRPKVDVSLPALAVRGFSVAGEATLQDDQGQPLRNTTFAYSLGNGASPVFGMTDAQGKASLASVTPLTGAASFAITVRGQGDVLASDYRSHAMTVVGPGTPLGYATLIVLVLALLVIAALVVAVAMLRRRQLGEAREIIQDAIQELLAGNEYQGVIFLAYRRFSAHLARYGYAEKESHTPREFAASVRKALPIGAIPLRELIRLFEEARYSDHPVGSEERDRAVESLASVRNELDAILGRKASAATPGVGA